MAFSYFFLLALSNLSSVISAAVNTSIYPTFLFLGISLPPPKKHSPGQYYLTFRLIVFIEVQIFIFFEYHPEVVVMCVKYVPSPIQDRVDEIDVRSMQTVGGGGGRNTTERSEERRVTYST